MKQIAVSMYLVKGNKMLFLVRDKKDDNVHKQGIYLPIGGKVELGENLEDAIKREVMEEAGVTVRKSVLKGMIYVIGQSEKDWIIFIYTSSHFSGEPTKGNEGYFDWVDLDKINDVNVYEGDKIYLDWLMTKQFFAIELHYKRFDFINAKVISVID